MSSAPDLPTSVMAVPAVSAPPALEQAASAQPPSAQSPSAQPPSAPSAQGAAPAAPVQGSGPATAEGAAQTATPTTPGPAPAAGAPFAVNVPGIGPVVPMTRDQVRAFDRRGELLSDQLQSAQGRRKDLIRELSSTTSPAVKAGIEERIRFLDERLLSLEQEIAENSAQKASLAANLRTTSTSESAPAPNQRDDSGGFFGSWYGIVLVIAVTITASRYFGRGAAPRRAAAPSPETEARMQQMEQAIDAVAIEIERVSEGQRFVTKLLREGQPIPDFTPGRTPETVGMRRDAESPR